MELELILKQMNLENIEEKIQSLSSVYEKTPSDIVKTGILTNIAFETLPNYKNYKYIISGITQARMIKGVHSSRNHINSQIDKILELYELNEINKDILDIASNLVIITFDDIFSNAGEKTKRNYLKALDDLDFLYINLKLAVKIIAETLRRNDIRLTNMTLQYVTDAIKREKNNIANEFIQAYGTGDEFQILEAKRNYHIKIENMLDNYFKKITYAHEDAQQIGEESTIVKVLGETFLNTITMILLHDINIKIKNNNGLQLNFNNMQSY